MCICLVADNLPSQNMVPFQTAYPMIAFLIYCILAGNTAFVYLAFVSSHIIAYMSSAAYLVSLFCSCVFHVGSWIIMQAFAFLCESE